MSAACRQGKVILGGCALLAGKQRVSPVEVGLVAGRQKAHAEGRSPRRPRRWAFP
jgi:hypothetical protein